MSGAIGTGVSIKLGSMSGKATDDEKWTDAIDAKRAPPLGSRTILEMPTRNLGHSNLVGVDDGLFSLQTFGEDSELQVRGLSTRRKGIERIPTRGNKERNGTTDGALLDGSRIQLLRRLVFWRSPRGDTATRTPALGNEALEAKAQLTACKRRGCTFLRRTNQKCSVD